jgi:hypothetical protein
MLTPDFEMYHDRDGVVARARPRPSSGNMARTAAPGGPDAVAFAARAGGGGLNVHPVPGFGAIEDGEHLFLRASGRRAGASCRPRPVHPIVATHPDGWRLARVFSYGHRAAR